MKKTKIQLRLTLIFCITAVVLLSAILYVFRASVFSGINENKITYVVDIGEIPYKVTSITERNHYGGAVDYAVSFESPVEDAPAFDTVMSAVPADMSLNAEYLAEWLHVAAVYDSYVREKDTLAMTYTGMSITDDIVENAKKQTKDMLMQDLNGVVSPVFSWFALLLTTVTAFICFLLSRLAINIADKLVVNDVWSKIERQYEKAFKDTRSKTFFGIDVEKEFQPETCPEPELPFRFWATDEEYNAYMSKRRSNIDMNASKNDIDTNDVEIKKAEFVKRGGLSDINVGKVSSRPQPASSLRSMRPATDLRKTATRVVGASNNRAIPELPKSSLQGVARRGAVATGNVSFTSNRLNHIEDIDV